MRSQPCGDRGQHHDERGERLASASAGVEGQGGAIDDMKGNVATPGCQSEEV